MKKILLSAVGATDPVRGGHDGAMLHIARHYRPDVVCLFISSEMIRLDAMDNRYKLAFEMLAENTGGYRPEVLRVELRDLFDPSVIGACDRIFREKIVELRAQYGADTQFLLNLSSGTPQMKDSWKQICLLEMETVTGVQVTSPAQEANREQTTASRQYNVQEELECDLDNLDDAPDRTREPVFAYDKRAVIIAQIRRLIKSFYYDAACILMEEIVRQNAAYIDGFDVPAAPENRRRQAEQQLESLRQQQSEDEITLKLLRYARDRKDLLPCARTQEQLKALPETLKTSLRATYLSQHYEYALLLDCLARSGHTSEFLIRLNPMVIEMEKAYLGAVYRIDLNALYDYRGRISRDNLEKAYPRLLELCEHETGGLLRDGEPSQFVLKNMLSACAKMKDSNPTEQQQQALSFFDACLKINEKRNQIAHDLRAVTESDVIAASGHDMAYFNTTLQQVMKQIDNRADSKRFGEKNPYVLINSAVEERLFL